ncbi:hypothetical protein SLEP1_g26877 [Rubroshorea leprosula]|uniref:Uncharacterized protein n=1 Tax=Rubroshorea leprosula TaxID=152421 RepID=A0AAV5JZT1_9ROSI|nr:hypothetical protein SLEP1_g26877 [Rubroshorea leprosula]
MELFVKGAPQQVVDAMRQTVTNMIGTLPPQFFAVTVITTSVTETSVSELAKLLYWLMVVAYSIRNIEVRFDMERVLGTPPKPPELPPGENN